MTPIDDYSAWNFWICVNVPHLISDTYSSVWPSWLDLDIGYSARNLGYPDRSRIITFALDYNLIELLPDGSPTWNWCKRTLNFLKLPSPAWEISPQQVRIISHSIRLRSDLIFNTFTMLCSNKYLLACFFTIAVFAECAVAQAPPDSEKITFGIGVAVYPGQMPGDLQDKFQAPGFTDVIIPVQIGTHIRVEGSLGIYLYTADETLPTGVSEHDARQLVRPAMGLFYTANIDKNLMCYFGGRMGIYSSESEITYTPQSTVNVNYDENWAGFYAGASFGMEYFISNHFSVGGEIQLNHIGYGAPVINECGSPRWIRRKACGRPMRR